MTPNLKPYPSCKDSGIPWLGEVPTHWEVLPNRALFAEVKKRNHPEEQMLSVTITKGVIRQQALLANSSKKDSSNQDKSAYKLVLPGDIAYNKMRAWQGAIGASDYRGIVSPAYVVQRPHKGAQSHYFHFLLRTPAFAKEAERWSYGITSDMWSLRPEHFKLIYGCLPPLPEQACIVRFIDHYDRKIRRYIRAKQKLTKLLEEQKQAIIHRAVTRGLDPNVRMKPSGVKWLGDVPEHWGMQPNGSLFWERKARGDPEWPTLVVSLRTGVTIGGEEDERGRPRRLIEDRTGYKKALKGDLAYNMMRMWQGAVGVAPVNGLVSPAYVVAAPRAGVDAAFYSLLFRTEGYKTGVERVSTGIVSDRNRLYWDDFKRLPSPVPPLAEQRQVVGFLQTDCAKIDAATAAQHHQITLLREYRTRLIADVVTGKLDVREEAARLPDEADEPDSFDERDASIDDDEDAAGDLGATPEEAEA